jgi:cation diffusion facilitator family transporter
VQAERGFEGPEISGPKRRAAITSLVLNLSLTFLKLAGALITGSVSLLSDAVHSATDVIASGLTYVSVRVAGAPPDDDHQFGHGKVESLTGFIEAVMIFVAVAFLGVEAVQRLMAQHPVPVQRLGFGVSLIGVCAVGSLVASFYVKRVGGETGSVALNVNARHLQIDFITSLGVFIGLTLSKQTGNPMIDPVLALGLALWLCFGAIKLGFAAVQEILDVRLPEREIAKIKDILTSDNRIVSFHRLRTRHSGSVHNIDLHIVVPREWTVVQAHEVADEIEHRIRAALAPAEVVVHVDPYDAAKAGAKSI